MRNLEENSRLQEYLLARRRLRDAARKPISRPRGSLIDRISHLFFSLCPSVCLSFSLPSSPLFFLFSAFARIVETLARRGSFIAFHFRDELTRSIGAWQKCNAREVRGHRLRSYTCEGEKQGPRARQGFIRDLHCASLVTAQGRVTKRRQ